ncbi:uncharacterized protein E6C27_scaffold418G00050 [Cucumis melo var. makuwa]|uniref:Gag-pol polyprotein n=1 Tax=Cucumis melo var. makuwa TaxID=1194695 RepID=A0A5A7VGI8_CUCMM|nr:uncharacterized protein E6C27_scaffold418G00050 [Cucumis melo var. makuwa]
MDLTSRRRDQDRSTTYKDKSDKSVRCHECKGYRHFQPECPTYLKRKKKILNITLSDEDKSSNIESGDHNRALISYETEGH